MSNLCLASKFMPSSHSLQAQFGTLYDYFNTLWKKTGVKPGTQPPGFPTLSGDFYTYADRFVGK